MESTRWKLFVSYINGLVLSKTTLPLLRIVDLGSKVLAGGGV
jgi:hypothetical protein